MADPNSLIYLVYSLLTLSANDVPTTDPSLKVWETTSEPSVSDSWHHDSQRYTERYNYGSCPSGEEWSKCDANCQRTCENVGKPVICPRMCVPGCVCSEGTVRDSDGSCVHPPLCRGTHEAPVTRSHDWDNYSPYSDDDYTFEPVDEVDPDESHRSRVTKPEEEVVRVDPDDLNPDQLNNEGCPSVSLCSDSCEKRGYKRGGRCVGNKKRKCRCVETDTTYPATFNPDEVDPYTRYPSVDPDEVTRATPEPENRGCPNERVCNKICQQKGNKGGQCTGRGKLHCKCSRRSPTRHSAVDPDEIDPYTKFPNVDPDEIDPVTRDPRSRVDPDEIDPVTRDPRSRVDPDEIDPVTRDPRSRVDPDEIDPVTRDPRSRVDPVTRDPRSRVDPDEEDHTDEYPKYTYNPDERDRAERDPVTDNPDERDRAERDPVTDLASGDECKDEMKCFKFCQSKGRQWGYCAAKTKKEKKTCNCSQK